jgi:hypothetical protein
MKRKGECMKVMFRVIAMSLCAGFSFYDVGLSQTSENPTAPESTSSDSNFVFASPSNDEGQPIISSTSLNSGGIDLLISNSGFGLGGFFRHQYDRDLFGTLIFSFSEVEDDNEVEYEDIYGNTYVPGKVNRFLLLPLLAGVQYRLFADEIMDNFRPYVNAGVGPTLLYSTPYDREFFSSLSYGQAHYTVGGYVGFGAFFGLDKSTLSGVNFRYYYIPISGGITSMQQTDGSYTKKSQFGGFFITLNFGTEL